MEFDACRLYSNMDEQIRGENILRGLGADTHDGVQTQLTPDDSPAEKAIWAVAACKGVDPTALEPLHDVIDPDAVDALFEKSRDGDENPTVLLFTMAGCRVRLQSDRTLTVSHTGEDI